MHRLGEMLGQCLKCGANVNDGSNFCNVCGMPVTVATTAQQLDENTDLIATLLVGLASMVLFFAFAMVLVAAVAEPGFWIVAIVLTTVGVVMLIARQLVVRSHRKKVEKIQLESIVNCKYCGGQNNKKTGRCVFCGAPLR